MAEFATAVKVPPVYEKPGDGVTPKFPSERGIDGGSRALGDGNNRLSRWNTPRALRVLGRHETASRRTS